MKVNQIIKDAKLLCRIDLDEDEFDDVLLSFLNTTLTDLSLSYTKPTEVRLPVINGKAEIEEGYRIISINPTLNIGDRVIGKTIHTSHTGLLKVTVIEEIDKPASASSTSDISYFPDFMLEIVKFNIAGLWYGYKKNVNLSNYWTQYYTFEKEKRNYQSEAEETYQMDLPFSSFFV